AIELDVRIEKQAAAGLLRRRAGPDPGDDVGHAVAVEVPSYYQVTTCDAGSVCKEAAQLRPGSGINERFVENDRRQFRAVHERKRDVVSWNGDGAVFGQQNAGTVRRNRDRFISRNRQQLANISDPLDAAAMNRNGLLRVHVFHAANGDRHGLVVVHRRIVAAMNEYLLLSFRVAEDHGREVEAQAFRGKATAFAAANLIRRDKNILQL